MALIEIALLVKKVVGNFFIVSAPSKVILYTLMPIGQIMIKQSLMRVYQIHFTYTSIICGKFAAAAGTG
jgi:hypothetical protein